MKKTLIIGGSGFVGSNLINLLGEENCQNIDKRQSTLHPDITKIHNICDDGLKDLISSVQKTIILLAAEHRDDVYPTSLYYDVNVNGTKKVLDAMDKSGIRNIIFTSSVAVYGLDKSNPDETHPIDPFNHYGESKWEAENLLRKWYNKDPENRSLTIIRPTVIFGEGNRGNVYNLLNQIASGRFLMIGSGNNKKSMAYVSNVASFIKHCIENQKTGYKLYNYVDEPDLSMKELIEQIEKVFNKKFLSIRIPYWIGICGGLIFDLISKLIGKKFQISAVRVKKFCATTQFNSAYIKNSTFKASYSLIEGLSRTLNYEFRNEVFIHSEFKDNNLTQNTNLKKNVTASIVLYKTDPIELKQIYNCLFQDKLISTLYLIDNSPTQKLKNVITNDNVVYTFVGKNLGYGSAHNIALRKIINKSDYHLVLNSDINFSSGVLHKLTSFMEKYQDVGLVLPKVLSKNGELQHLCKLIPTPINLIKRLSYTLSSLNYKRSKYQLEFTGYNSTMEGPCLSGCFMFLRTSALKNIGLFDERYFLYAEDYDLSRRINEKYKTLFYPKVEIVHNHTKESFSDKKVLLIHIISTIKYFNKWGWVFDKQRRKTNKRILKQLHYYNNS